MGPKSICLQSKFIEWYRNWTCLWAASRILRVGLCWQLAVLNSEVSHFKITNRGVELWHCHEEGTELHSHNTPFRTI